MAQSTPESVNRKLIKYQEAARAIASRQHIDLRELRWATKYAGRNIARMNKDMNSAMVSIMLQGERIEDELEAVNTQLSQLVAATVIGFRLTIAHLKQISGQLHQILQVLNYPKRTLGAEQREKGMYLAGKGRPQLAVESLQQAIKLNECDFISLYSLGVIFEDNQQYDAAAASYSESALYADINPALSAEAAIRAAHCYNELDQQRKAWAVLHRALDRDCPDVALPLKRYAASEAEHELAAGHVANAFVIDAELVITAESMQLADIDDMAGTALANLTDQTTKLEASWKQLYDAGAQAGATEDRSMPAAPKQVRSPRRNLMNQAIYRRRLQMAVSNLRDELSERLCNPLIVPKMPEPPYADYNASYRIKWAMLSGILALIVIAFKWIDGAIFFGGIASILVFVDARKWLDFAQQYMDYENDRTDIARRIRRIKAQNALLNSHREEVGQAVASADETLLATIPPAVPRAFSADLSAYTDNNTK